ncbi:MAG: sugar-binding protein [Flavobacteriaceae bacterium]
MSKTTLYSLIIGLLISAMSYSQLTVKKVTSEVALDGLLEETFWDISTQITIGSSNNTANFGVLWDDNYLYVGVDVEDTTLCTNKRQGFYDDGIEICIDGNNSQGTSFDSYDRIFVKPIRSYWIQEMEQRYSGVIHKWIETTNGYSMEFAIPWTNFNVTPTAGTDIGFNIVVNDDENCGNQHNMPAQLLWAGSSNYYNDPSAWGTISLSSETTSYSVDYISLLNPNGGEFCINNKTTEINWVSNGITNIDIDCSSDNGSTWSSVATNISASSGSYSWNVSATASEECLIKIYETGNASLNDSSESVFTISAPLTAVEPLIPNTWKNYQWPYNAYFPEDPNGINGHVGSACGHASLARILHYWEFPIVGNDALTFTDSGGHIWSADFAATTYNYDNMPNYLPPSSTEPEYTDVATLTYHAATSMHDIYGSGGDLANMSYAMSHYFNYKESTPTIRSGYTKAEWINILINELDNGRVLLIDGMTTEFLGDWHENNWVSGHWFHVDGYNEDGQFHGVLGFSDEDAWFDIDNLFGYYLNNGILVGLEPNLNGKELALQSHNGGESIQVDQVSQINWSSTGVSNIRIEYTVDNG